MGRKRQKSRDENFVFTHYTDEGDELEISIPGHFEVCDRCRGRGTHDHPAFSNGLTASDFEEDPDFLETYLEGVYDVSCEKCGGERVVIVPDLDRALPEDRAAYEQWQERERERRAEERAWERYQW